MSVWGALRAAYFNSTVREGGAGPRFLVPAISFQSLTGSAPYSRGHKKAQNRYKKLSLARQNSRLLHFLRAQERDHGLLRIALFRCHCLRVRIERHANCRVTQQLLHDLQLCASRSKQCRIGVTKSMPADSLRDA